MNRNAYREPTARRFHDMTPVQRRLMHAAACAALILALMVSVESVSGLMWPYDGDHFRDIAQAQVTRDGHPLADPHYAGETVWYNPLVPWIIAAGSAAFHMTPAEFHVRAGPWLNLIGPVAFYVAAMELAGPAAALAGLVLFVFFNAWSEPGLTTPTYSPWLFVATFAQGLFYVGVVVLSRIRGRTDVRSAVWLGIVTGITFLAHTGPALVLGVMTLVTIDRRRILIAAAVAAVVASPFLYSIVWRYHLHVVNARPLAWQWGPVAAENVPHAIADHALLFAGGLLGLILVRHVVARAWLGAAAVLFVYTASRDIAPVVPALVPSFHFWRYLIAILTVLSGATLWWICQRVSARHAVSVLLVLLTAFVAWRVPGYRSRFDFVWGRALAQQRDPAHAAITAFLRKSTPPGAVVLGSRGASLEIIGPAGRRVVAVNENWANPYIDSASRMADRDEMLRAIQTRDELRFVELADRYRVTHVVGIGEQECGALATSTLQPLYSVGTGCIYGRRSSR